MKSIPIQVYPGAVTYMIQLVNDGLLTRGKARTKGPWLYSIDAVQKTG
jgi:hypothetical protein